MSKKRASSPSGVPNKLSQPRTSAPASAESDDDGRGEFEDLYEDEYETDDVLSGEEDDQVYEAGEAVNGMELDDGEEQDDTKPYLPQLGQGNKELEEGEELVPDLSSYVMLHHAQLHWPCLSFDVLRDNEGAHRLKPPHNACVVAGTQAAETEAGQNEVVVMRWENLTKTQRNEELSDDEEEDDDDDAPEGDASLVFRSIPHVGGVNRIRAQVLPDVNAPPPNPYYTATFSETGKVFIYDIAPHLASLLSPAENPATNLSKKPLYTVTAHGRAEGFALAWSPPVGTQTSPRLLSGDIHSKIHLTSLTQSGISTSQPFASHTSSVEDIQWSPTEATVFASCSADRSLRIWDIRVKDRKSVLAVDQAHDSDVNVLSWNPSTSFLMLTGGDEGGLKVWDMRNLKSSKTSKPAPVASFNWHSEPITSVEWHPSDDSCFAASGADDQITLWDLSVEKDDEERPITTTEGDKMRDVPAQLLFVHQGQQDIKEVHWHPQLPGTVISTAASGFSIFKTISI